MTPEQWQRVSDLFENARQISPANRSQWLLQACGGDESLRRETSRLLQADERADQKSFLKPPEWVGEEFEEEFETEGRERRPYSREGDGNGGQFAFQHGFTPQPALLDQGSTALAAETTSLVRKRLRATALIYICIFGVLPFWRVLVGRTTDLVVTVLSAGVVVALGTIVVRLSRPRELSPASRKVLELGMLGMIAGLVTTIYYRQLLKFALSDNLPMMQMQMEHFALYAAMLILTFGLATPKRLSQAALIVVPLALLPFVTLFVLCWQYPPVLNAVQNWTDPYGQLSFQAMILLILAGGTAYEAQSVHRLRSQVAEVLRLNQYHLRQRIGFGGMGEVYLAKHRLLKRACAVKVIRPREAADPTVLARFEREVQATATLIHPNIVEIYDYGRSEGGTYYYVMEYLSGLSLEQLVRQHGALPPGRVVFLIRQVCLALDAAHAAGMIHRDIKPSNIMTTRNQDKCDVIKLLDFGLVLSAAEPATSHLTKEGQIFGTPLFMPPEQITGGSRVLNEQSDLYALGAVGYFLLTGRPPFDREQDLEAILAHAVDPVIPPSQLCPAVPGDLEQIILHCLEKKPNERIHTAQSLEQALSQCVCAVDWDEERAFQWWQNFLPDLPAGSPGHGSKTGSAMFSQRGSTPTARDRRMSGLR